MANHVESNDVVRSAPRLPLTWGVWMPLSYLALSALLLSPALLGGGTRLVGYGADGAMHQWFLQWFPYAISHGVNPFITNYATAPQNTNLLWNNANLLLGLAFWPVVRLLGAVNTLNLLYVVLMASAGSLLAWQLRPHVRHASSAWMGGAIFAFAPWMQSELAAAHLTMLAIGTLPLGWWIGTRTLAAAREKRHLVRWGLACGGWLILQYWSDKELLATTAVMVGCLVALRWFWGRRVDLALVRQLSTVVVVAIVVTAALLAVPLAIQFGSHVSLSQSTVSSPKTNVIDLLAYILPGYGQLVSSSFTTSITGHFTGELLETDLYLGLPLIVLVVVAACRQWGRPLVRFGVACTLLGAIFASGAWLHIAGHSVELPLPWLLLGHLPGYAKAIPARMAPFVLAGVACLLAAGWDEVRWRLQPPLQVLLALLLAATLLPSTGIVQVIRGSSVSMPRVLSSAALRALRSGAMVITVPIPTRSNHGISMYWQSEDQFRFKEPFGFLLHPSPSGVYTDNLNPSPLESLFLTLTDDRRPTSPLPRAALARQIQDWRVAAIVDVRESGFQNSERVLESLLGQPRMIDGAAVWLHPHVLS